eukprot:3876926-Prymnesium_polylepis.1
MHGRGVRAVLRVLEAHRRRLLFTVGLSATTGRENVVKFASVHFKTKAKGGAEVHAFPDPGYLDRLSKELDDVGVGEVSPLGLDEDEQKVREVRITDDALGELLFDPDAPDAIQRAGVGEVKMWRELQKKEVPRALTKEEQVGLLLETWRTIPDCGSVLLGEFDSSLNLRLRLNEIIAIKKMVPVPDESEECNWVRAVYDNGQNGILYGPAEAWRLPVIRFIEFLSTEGMRGPFVIVAHFSSLKLWSAVLHRCAPAVDVVTFAGGLAALSAAKQALEGLLQEMSRDRRGAKPIVMLVSLASAYTSRAMLDFT